MPFIGPVSASISGRSIASPTSDTLVTFSFSIVRSTSSGTNLRWMTIRWPKLKPMNAVSVEVPCISGGVGKKVMPVAARRDPLGQLLGRLHRLPGRRAAAQPGEEQVLLAPHHALGHAGGAAGVDDELVVGGARREAALRRARPPRPRRRGRRRAAARRPGGVPTRTRCRSFSVCGSAAATRSVNSASKTSAGEIGVPVEVDQLLLHVAVVDVDRHDPRLEAAEHGLQVLDAVVEVQAEVLAGRDARVDADGARRGWPRRPVPRSVSRRSAPVPGWSMYTSASRSGTTSTTDSNRSARLYSTAPPDPRPELRLAGH